MSAPTTDLASSSISSSGLVDGLGRRVLAFDRETGAMLERLHLRPELAVFEHALRERVEHLATLEDERFARPYSVERDPVTGELTVVAEFVAGCRLTDVLDTSYEVPIVPGVDVALGFMLESLPALSMLHMVNGVTHGVIDPARIVLTPTGQIVFLDVTFGTVVERLGLSRPRLWAEFGVAAPMGAGPVRFDAAGDIAQVALAALMLVLGRNLRPAEYPDALPSLLMEVVEVAQIRGSTGFAGGLQRILQRSLPIPGRRPYTTADEAVVDIRQLVRREIGVDVCRQALIDFVGQMDAAFSSTREYTEDHTQAPDYTDGVDPESVRSLEPIAALEEFLERASTETALDATDTAVSADEDPFELEISLDTLEPVVEHEPESVYDLPAIKPEDLPEPEPELTSSTDVAAYATEKSAPASDLTEAIAFQASESSEARPSIEHAAAAAEFVPSPPIVESLPVVEPPRVVEPPPVVQAPPSVEAASHPQAGTFELAVGPSLDVISDGESEPEVVDEAAYDETGAATAAELETEPESAGSSRRRKRLQQKSARARKDKLRSTTAEPKAAAPPPLTKEAPTARPAGPSGWLVTPHPEVPTYPAPPPMPAARIPQPVFAPPNAPTPVYGAPSIAPPRLAPVPPPQPVLPVAQPASTAVRVKADPPKGFAPKKTTPVEPVSDRPSTERMAALPYVQRGPLFATEEPRAFPWKLAATAVVVAGIAIFVGRSYLPGRQAVIGEPGAVQAAPAPAPVAAGAADTNDDAPIPAGKGRLIIQTQPAGVRVLLDQKHVGETPLKLDASVGRHVLTFVTSGGEVIRSVRVPSGRTLTVDVPVFSGWIAIFAPILLEVATGDKTLGTTEQNRLMLPPGRHELTLTNRELGYVGTEVVDIEPGEVKTLNLDPRGVANLNAVPWAEVWLDGLKLGETPLANTRVPLGLREFLFKHPEHGERRVTATIRANAPAAISVDFTK